MQFGEAYVEVRARLEDYEQDLKQAEQMQVESVDRVRRSAGNGNGSRGLGGPLGGPLGWGSPHAAQTVVAAVTLGKRLKLIKSILVAIRSTIGTIVLPIVLLSQMGYIIKFFRDLPQSIQRVKQWLSSLSLQQLLSDSYSLVNRIPIIGAQMRSLARTISEIGGLLGFDNFIESINEAEDAAARAEIRLKGMADAARLVKDMGLQDARSSAERRRTLVGLNGDDRIRAEGLFDEQDLIDQAARMGRVVSEKFNEEVKARRSELAEGKIDDDEFRTRIDILTKRRQQLMDDRERELAEALQATRDATTAKLRAMQKQNALREAQVMQDLTLQLAAAQARLELDGADERATAIRIGYQGAINRAVRDGEFARAELLRQIAETRVAEVRRIERQEWEARMDEYGEQAERYRRQVRDRATEVARAELELGMEPGVGRRRALAVFDANANADRERERIRGKIDALKSAQDEYSESLPFGVVTEDERRQYNAYSVQIKALERLIGLTEELRRKRIALADQRIQEAAERAGGRQISLRDIVPGNLATGAGDQEATGRRMLDENVQQTRELREIRARLSAGLPAYAN